MFIRLIKKIIGNLVFDSVLNCLQLCVLQLLCWVKKKKNLIVRLCQIVCNEQFLRSLRRRLNVIYIRIQLNKDLSRGTAAR